MTKKRDEKRGVWSRDAVVGRWNVGVPKGVVGAHVKEEACLCIGFINGERDAAREDKGKQKLERTSEDKKESVAEKWRLVGAREGGSTWREQGRLCFHQRASGTFTYPRTRRPRCKLRMVGSLEVWLLSGVIIQKIERKNLENKNLSVNLSNPAQ